MVAQMRNNVENMIKLELTNQEAEYIYSKAFTDFQRVYIAHLSKVYQDEKISRANCILYLKLFRKLDMSTFSIARLVRKKLEEIKKKAGIKPGQKPIGINKHTEGELS